MDFIYSHKYNTNSAEDSSDMDTILSFMSTQQDIPNITRRCNLRSPINNSMIKYSTVACPGIRKGEGPGPLPPPPPPGHAPAQLTSDPKKSMDATA